MTLTQLWFILIAVLWTGFFVLEGFDFGVGILHGYVGRDEAGRQAAADTIGPLWDGNEVWLVVAAAATFAAFPGWYATMFSGFYLVLVLVLVALILRGVAFEFRGRSDSPRWRRTWSALLIAGSVAAPLLIGIGLGDLLYGVPIGSDQEYTGNLLDLIRPYPVWAGLTLLSICVLHGSTFLTLKTTGDLRRRAGGLARRVAPVTAVFVLAFIIWTHVTAGQGTLPNVVEIAAVLAVVASAWLVREGRDGWAFTATTFAMATSVLAIFTGLFPRVMVSSTGSSMDLTIDNTSSGSYTLKLMTIVFVVLFPVVVLYQSWTYHVFRQRLSRTSTDEDAAA